MLRLFDVGTLDWKIPLGTAGEPRKNMQGWMGRWDAEMLSLEKVEHT